MKQLFTLFFLIVLTTLAKAQPTTGPGMVYDYDNAGYRVLRHYDPTNAQLLKPGRTPEGQQADTFIFSTEKNKLGTTQELLVRAYPNPARDVVFVENMSWKEGSNATIILCDVLGKELLTKQTTSAKESVTTENLVPGNYLIKYLVNNIYTYSWKIAKL